MNLLQKLHKRIEEENWNVKDQELIIESFRKVRDELKSLGHFDLSLKAEKEREAFSFIKNVGGIESKFQGLETNSEGIAQAMQWPDIKTWTEEDFLYISDRLSHSDNLFVRSEFGLILFLTGKLNPEQCVQLFEDLLCLSERYAEEIIQNGKSDYLAPFYNTVSLALHVAHYKRSAPGFSDQLERGLLFVEKTHRTWISAGRYLLRTAVDLTSLVIKYFSVASKVVDVGGFFDRNLSAANGLEKTYTWGAIYIIDENINLSKFIGRDTTELIRKKAVLYGKLAGERRKGDLSIATFIETALRLYEKIGDEGNVKRLQRQFENVKRGGDVGSFHMQLPQDEFERITSFIQQEVRGKDEKDILNNFVYCPMYLPIAAIRQNAKDWKEDAVLSFMAGASISDKFGNTIAKYSGNSEEWAFLEAYDLQFQAGTHSLTYFFMEAFKAGKITRGGISAILQQSWIGEAVKRSYNNQEVIIYPIELILPPIELMLDELNKWKHAVDYEPNLITITDSMVLKIEALLRYLCDRLSMNTFKLRDDGLVMERNLDEILASLEDKEDSRTNFLDDDRMFIKYVLSEKAGENLRNRIAHGLMDAFEYSIDKTILAFTIIMRLTKYHFKPQSNV